jgi:hypothetical protein
VVIVTQVLYRHISFIVQTATKIEIIFGGKSVKSHGCRTSPLYSNGNTRNNDTFSSKQYPSYEPVAVILSQCKSGQGCSQDHERSVCTPVDPWPSARAKHSRR